MKATLTFDLNDQEDAEAHLQCIKAAKMEDIKINVDFKDTCIDFGKYVHDHYKVSDGQMEIDELWEQYQELMNKEVRDILTDEGNEKLPENKMTAEEFYKDHFGHTSQHVSMDKIFVCMELYARHQKATQEIKQ